jgi:hypothetical protein
MAFVPYRGGPQALLDLAEGRIQAVVSTLAAALGRARGGRVRMLATAARARAPAAPDLPTAAEAGFPGFWVEGLLGLFGWRGMPEAARDGCRPRRARRWPSRPSRALRGGRHAGARLHACGFRGRDRGAPNTLGGAGARVRGRATAHLTLPSGGPARLGSAWLWCMSPQEFAAALRGTY